MRGGVVTGTPRQTMLSAGLLVRERFVLTPFTRRSPGVVTSGGGAWPLSSPRQVGRRSPAQQRSRPAGEDGRQVAGLQAWCVVTDPVDAAVHADESAL